MIIDTHAHLMFPEFKKDLENVLLNCKNVGISKVINVGVDILSSKESIKMARENNFLFSTLGLHPYEAENMSNELLENWEKEIQNFKKIVAIGECGLDYNKAKIDKEIQKKCFKKQLEFARKVNLPVIVHNRDADGDCLDVLQDFLDIKVVFHCFSSNLEFAKKIWDLGFMTSFTGVVTFPKADSLRKVVEAVPLDKFMVETDCPYLAPQKYRGDRNEPAFVVEVVEKIAEIKGVDREEIEKLAYENTLKFFKNLN